jgi:RNA polymerase sigma-70 factor (ECF subfamily)
MTIQSSKERPMSTTADVTEMPVEPTQSEAERIAWFIAEVVRLRPKLYQQAMRICRNHSDAEDLVQETLAKAYGALDRFRAGTNFAAWLYRIMVNSYINGYRKQRRRPQETPTEEVTDAQLATFATHTSTGLRSAEESALDRLPDNEIRGALAALPERLRLTVYYADVAGYRFKEIAELTNAPLGTVMSRLHRGRKQLRARLAHLAAERGYAACCGAMAG